VNAQPFTLRQFEPRLATIPVDLIDRSPYQCRVQFDPLSLERLAQSLKTHGQAQPIVVRENASRYELVAGERRWRAAQIAGLHELLALVRPYSDAQSAELALVENELREQVNPIDTARAVTRLIDRFNHTHEEVGAILGLERSSVTNLLRLLTLDPDVQAMVGSGDGKISVGHAKLLVGLQFAQQRSLANRAIREDLSVRALMRLVKMLSAPQRMLPGTLRPTDPNIAHLEQQLTEHLGQRACLAWSGTSGELTLQFTSHEELEGFFDRIGFQME
jgi:ParB family transcriptional regulator, chromosome partitioning protein